MRFNKLVLITFATFLAAGILMVSNMRAQDKEILSLRERVHNLEVVINYEIRASQNNVSMER